jgi:tetratricopeptide (TPR) repeat protein
MRYAEAHDAASTLQLAEQEAAGLPPGTPRLNVVLNAIEAGAEPSASGSDEAAKAAYERLLTLGAHIAEAADEPVLLDDRSSLYMSLVSALAQRDPTRSASLARNWSALLDAEAARAQLPAARRVWDAHRMEAYLALGDPARALPMLQQSQHEVPDDYNPPARLARVYLAMQRPQLAKAAVNQALTRCEGPRKLKLFLLKADILIALQDTDSARSTLRIALDFARDKQLGAQYDSVRKTIERKLADLT